MSLSGDEQEAKIMLETHQLLQICNYKIRTAVAARGSWLTSMVILDTGTGPNLIRKTIITPPWTPLVRTVKASCLWLVSNNPWEAKGFISRHLRIRQPHQKVVFLVVPGLTTNMLLGTTVIGWYIRRMSPKAETINHANLSPAAIAKAVKRSRAMAAKNNGDREKVEASCVIAQLMRLSLKSETFVGVKTSARGIHLGKTHDNLVRRHQTW